MPWFASAFETADCKTFCSTPAASREVKARTVLAFTQRAAAIEINKVLGSAVANAEANHGMRGDELLVSACYVDEGPTIKRFRARARGRVARINKRTCHITVRLAENPKAVAARPKPKAKPKAETTEKPKRAPAKKRTTTPAKKREATA